jgi:hypothetical protein
MSWDSRLHWMFIYHLFGGLWGSQFIAGFGWDQEVENPLFYI